jgi:hypothetical protein
MRCSCVAIPEIEVLLSKTEEVRNRYRQKGSEHIQITCSLTTANTKDFLVKPLGFYLGIRTLIGLRFEKKSKMVVHFFPIEEPRLMRADSPELLPRCPTAPPTPKGRGHCSYFKDI